MVSLLHVYTPQYLTLTTPELVKHGVAYHHAGLAAEDRAVVEDLYLRGELGVICCTSTLAVGVNLPCHTVIIKGTAAWEDGVVVELSDIELLQMLGRAGRPQFDTSALAIIMTKMHRKDYFATLVNCQQILESRHVGWSNAPAIC